MAFDYRTRRDATNGSAITHAELVPGKRTLTEQLPVQRRPALSEATGVKTTPAAREPDPAARAKMFALFGVQRAAVAPSEDLFGGMQRRASVEPSPVQRNAPGVPFLQLGAGPTQQRASGEAAGGETAAIHEAAQRAIATPATQLPYLEQIQRSFGRHDVSGVKAHAGADAAASARAMGAEAYATGNHVVLGGRTDLHVVAHEAAHVVQQRGGVQLKGGVGEEGDRHEQHADEVAALVVQGKSAEHALDRYAGVFDASTADGDLFTTAHEVAHVVQQRAGVTVADGVSAPGDRYEQQADAVAARVVRGESAAGLLDEVAAGTGGPAVQRVAIPGTDLDTDRPGELMAIVDHIRSTDTLGRMELLALKAQLAGGGAHLDAVVRAINERILALDADQIRDAYNDDERYRNHAKVTMHVNDALFFESPIRHSGERTSAELSPIRKLWAAPEQGPDHHNSRNDSEVSLLVDLTQAILANPEVVFGAYDITLSFVSVNGACDACKQRMTRLVAEIKQELARGDHKNRHERVNITLRYGYTLPTRTATRGEGRYSAETQYGDPDDMAETLVDGSLLWLPELYDHYDFYSPEGEKEMTDAPANAVPDSHAPPPAGEEGTLAVSPGLEYVDDALFQKFLTLTDGAFQFLSGNRADEVDNAAESQPRPSCCQARVWGILVLTGIAGPPQPGPWAPIYPVRHGRVAGLPQFLIELGVFGLPWGLGLQRTGEAHFG